MDEFHSLLINPRKPSLRKQLLKGKIKVVTIEDGASICEITSNANDEMGSSVRTFSHQHMQATTSNKKFKSYSMVE